MSKPNFQTMTKKELRNYLLSHRDDQDAFCAFVDKLTEQPDRVLHPPLTSVEDMQNYPEVIQRIEADPGRQV